MKIVVTGGLGYVGSVLLSEFWNLVEDNINIIDSCKYGGQSYSSYMEYITLNTTEMTPDNIPDIVKSADVVVHLAATVGFPACDKDVNKSYINNVLLTKALTELVKPSCHFIFASTTSVYGKIENANENMECFPSSNYAKQKLEAENYVKKLPKHTIFRFSTAFGLSPNFRKDLLPHTFVISAIKNKYIPIFEPEAIRSFVHVKDMAECISYAIDEEKYGIFNIGSNDNQITKRELAKLITEYSSAYIFEAKFNTDPEQRFNQIDYSKAKLEKFPINISLRKGIRALIQYAPIYINERTEE